MRMEDFRVGDRVRATGKANWAGETGTIVCVVGINVGVRFDQYHPHRHDLCYCGEGEIKSRCESGYGWWYWAEGALELLGKEEPFPDVDDLL